MTMFDSHIHTKYSPDSKQDIMQLCHYAVEKGFQYIALTDHCEADYIPDFDNLFLDAERARIAFPTLTIAVGVEIGFYPEFFSEFQKIADKYPFDLIINSVHTVDNDDCFFKKHFKGKTKEQAFKRYFETVYDSLNAPYYFSTVGHLSYIARNAPYPDPRPLYKDYADQIDRILKRIISMDRIMEVNSSAYHAGAETLPDEDIIRRYFELGGRKINFASDAHQRKRIGDKYPLFLDMLKRIGFEGITLTLNKKDFFRPTAQK